MNSEGWEKVMTERELAVVQGRTSPAEVPSITAMESLAIEYARKVSASPLAFDPAFGARLTQTFTEREVVVLAQTAAQVNYWARLIQALGSPPEY
jgi:alkylhydroperoxidase family enzyme